MPNKAKPITINLIRFILVLAIIYATTSHRPIVQTVAAIALLTTFIPTTLEKLFNIKIPAAFEIIYLMSLYGLLMLGELRGFFHGTWWWTLIMTFTASIALGFTALSITHALQKTSRITNSSVLAVILIFALTISFATLWELFEFTLDLVLKTKLQTSLQDTMQDLAINLFGAIIISTSGYISQKKGKALFASHYLTSLFEKSIKSLAPKIKATTPQEITNEIIKIGETSKIEFKSTLRTNLHTNGPDKKIELAVLKTITAFLNTSGGSLVIGLSDDKKPLGLKNDNFQNNDKLLLHLTNLIKTKIGNAYLPFIKTHIVKHQEESLILILTKKSQKPVFLKKEGKEEFFVRNGPSSVKLEGSSLIDYINHKF